MNRQQLIEEIKENYVGTTPHESVLDYMNEASDEELHFFHWCFENGWRWYDSSNTLIHSVTRKIISANELLKTYFNQPKKETV